MPSLPPLVGWPLLCWVPAWFWFRELRCRPWIRTAWGVDPRLWGARGPKQCPFGWLSGELPMASAWTRTLPLLSAVWRRRDAGPEVAVAWQQARARSAEGDSLALVHAAALAGRQVSQASRPPLPRRYKPVPLHGRVRQQAAVGPPKEGITTAMIDELSALLVDARCRRPRGELTYARQAEWEMSVKRLVQNHAATAEATTFKNAVKTLQELYHFQILRGRAQGLEEVDPVDLDAFLHGGTTAPTRGLQALRWISKNAQLQWALPELRRVKQPKAVGEQQAMVVEPPLLSHLEDRISAMCKAGDARWTALLGQWLVGVGVLRYKHLNLSTVLKITPSTVHCFCSKGKQAKLRQGFYWCVPATFSNRFAWTKPWVDQFQLLSPARRKHCGLRPWSRLESVRATQAEFRAVLEEPSLLTSYSWRRLGTTVGLLANFSVPQLAALGDWGDRISDTQAKMPVRYAGSRYALSRFCKHYAYYVGFACSGLHCLGGYPTACCGRSMPPCQGQSRSCS